MDPISALIGAGASLFGGFMNSSSQQAMNTANLQFATEQASGAFLPAQVANAKAAGINPLAIIGSGSGAASAPRQVGTEPGAGISAIGRQVMGMDLAHAEELKKQEITKNDIDIANARAAGNNTAIDTARKMWELEAQRDWYRTHHDAPPPGASPSSVPDMTATELNAAKSHFDAMGAGISSVFSRIPQSMWSTP